MNPSPPRSPRAGAGAVLLRTVLPILLVTGLTRLSAAQDFFSGVSRPIVLGLLGLLGVPGEDLGHTIRVGRLEVPWTGDCAGLNLLLLLLAVAIWVNRREPLGWRYAARVLLMVPAAVVANVARIFTLLAYREWNYPGIESPQLHYFFGLAWLVPFAVLAMPGGPRPLAARVFELLHVAAIIALLAPLTDGPGGISLAVAVVLGLAHCRLPARVSPARAVLLGVWLVAAGGIALTGMESFWLPWLLVCPLLADPRWVFRPAGAVLTLAAHPLFAMIPGAEWITWAAVAAALWGDFRRPVVSGSAPAEGGEFSRGPGGRVLLGACAALFVLPFLASTLIAGKEETWSLPVDADRKSVPGNGYALRLPGQPEQLGLLWYPARGTERHHSVTACLKYRGISLAPLAGATGVFTDGTHLVREYFLQNGRLISTHLDYVLATLGPRTSAGVHLIFMTPKDAMSVEEFQAASARTAAELFAEITREKAAADPAR